MECRSSYNEQCNLLLNENVDFSASNIEVAKFISYEIARNGSEMACVSELWNVVVPIMSNVICF